MTQPNLTFQGVKKEISMLFFCLLIYGILFLSISTLLAEKIHLESGIMLIITVLISFIPVGLFLSKTEWKSSLTAVYRKISLGKFVYLFMVLITVNLIAVQAEIPLEKMFGIIGISAKTGGAETIGSSVAFLIYTCLFGPFMEELIYRGVLLRTLKKVNVVFAVVITAFCFGIMHHDLYQGIAAFAGGLVYGYVSVRYSFRAGVMLHIANNSLAMAMPYLKSSGTPGTIVILLIVFTAGIVTLAGAIRNVFLFLRKRNKTEINAEVNCSEDIETISFSALWMNYSFWALIIFDMICLIVISFHPVIK